MLDLFLKNNSMASWKKAIKVFGYVHFLPLVLGMEPRVSPMLSACSATELHLQPCLAVIFQNVCFGLYYQTPEILS